MRIKDVKLFELRGVMKFPGVFWEERLVRPVDVYPEHKSEAARWLDQIDQGEYAMTSVFVEIETDEGVSGTAGPIALNQAFIIRHELEPLLIGHDPLATERIWDRLYRSMVHGRKGTPMMALRKPTNAPISRGGMALM